MKFKYNIHRVCIYTKYKFIGWKSAIHIAYTKYYDVEKNGFYF